MPDITIPLWAALIGLAVVFLLAAALGAARFGTARRVLGPWVHDRAPAPRTVHVHHVDQRPGRREVDTDTPNVRVIGPADVDGER